MPVSKQQHHQDHQNQPSKVKTTISSSKGSIITGSTMASGVAPPLLSRITTTTGGEYYEGSRRIQTFPVPKSFTASTTSSDSLSATASLSAADFLNQFDLSQTGLRSFYSNKVPTITLSAAPSTTIAQTRLRTVDMSAQVGQEIDAETSFISGVTSSKLRLREGSSLMFPTLNPPNIVLHDNTDHHSELSNYSFNDSIRSGDASRHASPVMVDMNFIKRDVNNTHRHHHHNNNDDMNEVSSWPSSMDAASIRSHSATHSAGSFELGNSFHMDTVIAPHTPVAQFTDNLFIDAMDYINHQQSLAQSGTYNNNNYYNNNQGPIEVVSSRYNSPKSRGKSPTNRVYASPKRVTLSTTELGFMSSLVQAVKSEKRKERLKSGQLKINNSRSYSADNDDTGQPDQVKKVPFIKISSLSALEQASKSKSRDRSSGGGVNAGDSRQHRPISPPKLFPFQSFISTSSHISLLTDVASSNSATKQRLRGHLLNSTPYPDNIKHLNLAPRVEPLPGYLQQQHLEQQQRYENLKRNVAIYNAHSIIQSPDSFEYDGDLLMIPGVEDPSAAAAMGEGPLHDGFTDQQSEPLGRTVGSSVDVESASLVLDSYIDSKNNESDALLHLHTDSKQASSKLSTKGHAVGKHQPPIRVAYVLNRSERRGSTRAVEESQQSSSGVETKISDVTVPLADKFFQIKAKSDDRSNSTSTFSRLYPTTSLAHLTLLETDFEHSELTIPHSGEALDPVVDQKDDDEQLEVEAPAETLPFQPHKRLMGWKLANLKRRQNLVTILDLANSVSMESLHPKAKGGGRSKHRSTTTTTDNQQQQYGSAKRMARKDSLRKLQHTPLTLLGRNKIKKVPPLSRLQTEILSIQAQQMNTGGRATTSSTPSGTNRAGQQTGLVVSGSMNTGGGGGDGLEVGQRFFYDKDYDQQAVGSSGHHELKLHHGRPKQSTDSSHHIIRYSKRQMDAYRHAVTRQLQQSLSFSSPSAIRRIMESQRKRAHLLSEMEPDSKLIASPDSRPPFLHALLPPLTDMLSSSGHYHPTGPGQGITPQLSTPHVDAPVLTRDGIITHITDLEHSDVMKEDEYGVSNPSMNTLVSKFYSFAFEDRPNNNNYPTDSNNHNNGSVDNILEGVDIQSNLLNRLVKHRVFQEVPPDGGEIPSKDHTMMMDTVSSHYKRVSSTPGSGLNSRGGDNRVPGSGRVTPQVVKELYDYPLNPHKTYVDRSDILAMISTRSKIDGRRATPVDDSMMRLPYDRTHPVEPSLDYHPSSSGMTFSFNPSSSSSPGGSMVFNQDSIDLMSSLDLDRPDQQMGVDMIEQQMEDHMDDEEEGEGEIDYDDVLSASDTSIVR